MLIPGSGSSSFSFRRGKAGRRASGNARNTLYIKSTAFFLMYGFVDDNFVKYQELVGGKLKLNL